MVQEFVHPQYEAVGNRWDSFGGSEWQGFQHVAPGFAKNTWNSRVWNHKLVLADAHRGPHVGAEGTPGA